MALINQSITGGASLVHIISTVLVCGLDKQHFLLLWNLHLCLSETSCPRIQHVCVDPFWVTILYLETTPNIIIYQSQCQKSPVLDPSNAGLKFLSILQSNHAKSPWPWCILMQHKIIQFPFWPLNSVEYIIFIHFPENFPILSLKLGLNIPILLG